jgi:hypothetical protein
MSNAGQAGELQLLFYLGLYVIIASILLSLFVSAIGMSTGMVVPGITQLIDNQNSPDSLDNFINTFTGLLVWVVPQNVLPMEIQVPFIVFPKVCIAGIGIILLLRLIP